MLRMAMLMLRMCTLYILYKNGPCAIVLDDSA
jgi:hypothetical protein